MDKEKKLKEYKKSIKNKKNESSSISDKILF
jgi:hypothetical protein